MQGDFHHQGQALDAPMSGSRPRSQRGDERVCRPLSSAGYRPRFHGSRSAGVPLGTLVASVGADPVRDSPRWLDVELCTAGAREITFLVMTAIPALARGGRERTVDRLAGFCVIVAILCRRDPGFAAPFWRAGRHLQCRKRWRCPTSATADAVGPWCSHHGPRRGTARPGKSINTATRRRAGGIN